MPDFDRLHLCAQRLADLTKPGKQEPEPGLATWCMFVGNDWGEIARMWEDDPKRAAAPELYAALEEALKLIDGLRYGPSQGYEPETQIASHIRAVLAKARGEHFATMALPQGWTCADCGYFHFCKDFIGRAGHETSCDWYPSRFSIDPTKVTRKEPTV
jgi:hypothetical protein